MSKEMPEELRERFEFLRQKAKNRYDNATNEEEINEALMEIDSLEKVFKSYYYSYDMMEALS